MNKKLLCLSLLSLLFFFTGCNSKQTNKEQNSPLFTIECENYKDLETFFRYTPDSYLIVSGHRGGRAEGYPENSIEVMEYTLRHMPSFFEIDPRITKDSVLVLMHDETIDRTTTGTGKVKDYTYKELLQFNLKDHLGNETSYKIPKVEDVIRWSQGKTILNFDKKDAPRDLLIQLANRLKARNVIYTVHTPEDAMECYKLDSNAHFSAWIKDLDAFEGYKATGIPMSRFIAYVVSTTIDPNNQALYDALHKEGIRCMIAMSPSHDKLPTSEERIINYKKEIEKNPDIIETDYPVEFVGIY